MNDSLSFDEKNEFYAIILDQDTQKKLIELDPKTYIGDSPKRTELTSRQIIEMMNGIDTRVILSLNRPRLLAV